MTDSTGVPFLDTLLPAIATEAQSLVRALGFGNWNTAGPTNAPPAHDVLILHPAFTDGWWHDAQRIDAHLRRMGGPIKPWSTGVHTTDMLPDEWDALIDRWHNQPGDGACANFLIGRTPEHGVVQMVPITRNSNHLGGPGHGVFVVDGNDVHPNLVANGIEIHCAGGVRLVNGGWRLVEGGVAHGKPIPAEDVIVDPARPTRGVHKVTDYQYEQLDALLRSLDSAQYPVPAGATTKAFGEDVPAIAKMPTARVVTHWQMDPVHRGDPWRPTCEWLAKR